MLLLFLLCLLSRFHCGCCCFSFIAVVIVDVVFVADGVLLLLDGIIAIINLLSNRHPRCRRLLLDITYLPSIY